MERVKQRAVRRPPIRREPGQAHWAVEAAKLKILLEAVWRMSCARASGDNRMRVPAEQFEGDLRSLAEIVNDMARQGTC
jgi:hypothetical protein